MKRNHYQFEEDALEYDNIYNEDPDRLMSYETNNWY
jgi:hypothetical protein